MSRPGARLQLVAAAALFSTGGAAVKATDLTSWQVAGFRAGIAALTLLLLVPSARRGWTLRALGVGVLYAATLTMYVQANKLTTAANAIFLQGTAPLYVLALSPLLLGERVRPRDLLFMLAIALGLGLFFLGDEAPLATAPDPFTGNLLAAATGLGWGLTMLGLRALGRDDATAGLAPVVLGNLVAFFGCLPFAIPDTLATGFGDLGDVSIVVYLGVFQVAVAYILVMSGIRSVPALEASLLLMIEPTFGPFWAWLVHTEIPGPWSLAGGALVLGATLFKSVMDAPRPAVLHNDTSTTTPPGRAEHDS